MSTLAFFKPYGVLSHFTDEDRQATLAAYIPMPGVYAAGRLDKDSEGLLLLTDDGRLAHQITSPQRKLAKTYLAQVERVPDETALEALRHGVIIEGVRTLPAQTELLPEDPVLPPRAAPIRYRKNVPTSWLRIVLIEGRNRQVRHMTAAVGHPTLRLVRIAIGPITLGDLAPGEWRELSGEEVKSLRALTQRHVEQHHHRKTQHGRHR
jgi:23S rRNA pseudouridine2457 synthase